ncbi:hypothetical protein BAUCODRAFT_54022, partial [Baudoinia panamericana UAMH 10762]
MRLLNCKTHKLHDFLGDDIPDYVILSHRWTAGEVTYKDFRKNRNVNSLGSVKIMLFCAFARSRVREWVWIDTCCIDKRSSAEVSEAVNSMFTYYQNARECYVYLSDVPPLSHGRKEVMTRFTSSEWFLRGWTLQELLAPSSVVFLTKEWEIIGSRDTLADQISTLTTIPTQVIQDYRTATNICVAQKLSWAARRQTTRAEDMAYCLLGLLGVNMALLYGEGGAKAFKRLQLQIIADKDDETIFAF